MFRHVQVVNNENENPARDYAALGNNIVLTDAPQIRRLGNVDLLDSAAAAMRTSFML